MYRSLTSDEDKLRSERAFRTVFRSPNPFDEPFQSHVQWRAIVYPAGYFLNEAMYKSVMECAHAVEDSGAYITQVEGWKKGIPFRESEPHGLIEFPGFDYANARADFDPIVIETAFYSITGRWGLITSHLGHAVIGGTHGFIECLGSHIDLEASRERFLMYLGRIAYRNGDVNKVVYEWAPRFLTHIYGHDRATEMMTAAGIPFPK